MHVINGCPTDHVIAWKSKGWADAFHSIDIRFLHSISNPFHRFFSVIVKSLVISELRLFWAFFLCHVRIRSAITRLLSSYVCPCLLTVRTAALAIELLHAKEKALCWSIHSLTYCKGPDCDRCFCVWSAYC